MPNRRVLVFGSLAYDRIFDYPNRFRDAILPSQVHVLNVSFTVSDVRESYGGTAGNIAYTLRLLGVPTSVVSAVGKDFGRYRSWLRRQLVDLRGVTESRQRETAAAYIITDRDDNQISAFQLGAMIDPLPGRTILNRILSTTSLAILAPGNVISMVKLGKALRRAKIPYIFDPGQVLPMLSTSQLRRLIRGSAGLVSNDYELKLLLHRLRLNESALARMTRFIVTTLGSKGARLVTSTRRQFVRPGRPSSVVDPTGAGDAFRSGFIAGYIQNYDLPACVRMGNVAALYTVEMAGTQTHTFSRPSFRRRYQATYHEKLLLK